MFRLKIGGLEINIGEDTSDGCLVVGLLVFVMVFIVVVGVLGHA